MKFSHIADVHIGGYREDKLKDISLNAFISAIDISVKKSVDFILICGDLFNTSLPNIDSLKVVTSKFRELKELGIGVYIIAGSHDFSPSGKTMIDVLENAGLCVNVVKGDIVNNKLKLKFTVDPKTGAKITGLLGKRGSLEKTFYESLDLNSLEQESGFKIFMFHTAITELKMKGMENMSSAPKSLLPKNFNYYAGGHVHYPYIGFDDCLGGIIAYTGALFPNNFKELEDLGSGGFFIYDTDFKEPIFEKVCLYDSYNIFVDCNHKTPEDVFEDLHNIIKSKEFYDMIVLIRLRGKLKIGRVSDIDLKSIVNDLYSHGAYFVMKNTLAVESEEFNEIKIQTDSVEKIEEQLINEHAGQYNFNKVGWDVTKEKNVIRELIQILNMEKEEGETISVFEDRVKGSIKDLLNL
jgi:exonuclease SbcD